MTRFFIGAWLMLKLASRRLDIDRDLFLLMWQNRAIIEVYDAGPSVRARRLSARIDAVFPF